jgi:hypothetical protein
MKTFASIIEEVKQLSFDEKKELLHITKQYLVEEARNKIYQEHKDSLDELKEDKLHFSGSIDDLKENLKDL